MNHKLKIYLLFLFLFCIQFCVSLYINSFNFAYPLDDAYIHLAIAKNFGLFGVWGPTSFEFASSSSSLLYTLLLSLFFATGLSTIYLPIILNLISVFFLIDSLDRIISQFTGRKDLKVIFIILAVFLMPAIALTLSGMEHILHTALILYFLHFALKIISDKAQKRDYYLLYLFTFLSCSVRYESLFLVAGLSIVMIFKRRFLCTTILAFIAILPMSIFGIISINQGSYFLPNTLLIKGNTPSFTFEFFYGLFVLVIKRIFTLPHIFSSIVIIVISMIYSSKKKYFNQNLIFIMLLISWLLHLSFAGVGWFYRYEAYLIVCSLLCAVPLLNIYFERVIPDSSFSLKTLLLFLKKIKPLYFIVIMLLIGSYSYRLFVSLYKSSIAPKNIYEQQVQMAQFTNRYNTNSIILNDIGTVSYFCKAYILDINGLGNFEIAKAIKNKEFNQSFLSDYSKRMNSEIAIIYNGIHDFPLPEDWRVIGSWKIRHNVICWKDEIFFYSMKESDKDKWRQNLMEFSQSLPKDVEVVIY